MSLKNLETCFDVAVIGAGPAGMMAAIRASQLHKRVIVLEKNTEPGKKLLITGGGRCNITNSEHVRDFIKRFGKNGEFLRTAFSLFFREEMHDLFRQKKIQLAAEEHGKIYPKNNNAQGIVKVLKEFLAEGGVAVQYSSPVTGIVPAEKHFAVHLQQAPPCVARAVIIATGGISYPETGSTGSGFLIARSVGHAMIPLKPGLVPLVCGEPWIKDLAGVSLPQVCFHWKTGQKRVFSEHGDIVFTHTGISGPLVLDISNTIVPLLEENKKLVISLDCNPTISDQALEQKINELLRANVHKEIKNICKDFIPLRLAETALAAHRVDPRKKANSITRQERLAVMRVLKHLDLTVTGSLPIEQAMVTIGGIPVKEIDPRTMQSTIVPGLFFAGEIIDVSGTSGGYNLQQAFSTGYLAGQKAAEYFTQQFVFTR
jgi:hypothetical protein